MDTKRTISRSARTDRNFIHYSLRNFLLLMHCLGLFPIQGILSSPDNLRFKWFSLQSLYTVWVTLCVLYCSLFLNFVYNLVLPYEVDSALKFILCCAIIFSIMSYISLAKNWPELIQAWCKVDHNLNSVYGYPRNLNKKLNWMIAFYVLFILGGYLIFLTVDSATYYSINPNVSFMDDYRYMTGAGASQNYKLIILTPPLVQTFLLMVALNFNDTFIILISIALAERFKQIVERLKQHKATAKDVNFWIQIRGHYSDLGNLCRQINEKLGYIVLVSFALNIYFLLVELCNIISLPGGSVYFVNSCISFGFHVLRLFLVFVYAAWINDESRRPIRVLFSASSDVYNIEIRRWLMQMHLDSVALTGYQVKVTRGLILSIAGAVVSYELMYIQFKQEKN